MWLVFILSSLSPAGYTQPVMEWSPSFFDLRVQTLTEFDTTLAIYNRGTEPLTVGTSITYRDSTDWLFLQPDTLYLAPADSEVIRLQVETTALPPGLYYAMLNLTTNDPQNPDIPIPVIMRLINHPGCQLILPHNGLLQTQLPQEADTTLDFFVLNIGDAECIIHATPGEEWLAISPATFEIQQDASEPLSVTVNTRGLSDGEHWGQIEFRDQAGNFYGLDVQVTVTPVCLQPVVHLTQAQATINIDLFPPESGYTPVLVRVWQRYGESDWELRYSLPMQDSLHVELSLVPESPNWFRFQTVCEGGVLSTFLELGPFIYPSTVGAVMDGLTIPAQSQLLPAVPNPFNPVTTIRYELAKAAAVRIDIYDFSGKHVRQLVNGLQNAGVYHVQWDGCNQMQTELPSGLYFCHWQAGAITAVKPLVLLR